MLEGIRIELARSKALRKDALRIARNKKARDLWRAAHPDHKPQLPLKPPDVLAAYLERCEYLITHVLVSDDDEYPHEEIHPLSSNVRPILYKLWAGNFALSLKTI